MFGSRRASSLKALCIPCEFLADLHKTLRKCLASSLLRKFLARSLQVFCIVSGVWRFGRIPEFNTRSDAKTQGASSGGSGARLFQERVLEHLSNSTFDVVAPLGRFWVPCWTPLDFEGVLKSIIFPVKATA